MRPAPLRLLLALLALAASPALGQVAPQRPVDDIDLPAPKPPPSTGRREPAVEEPPAPVEDGSREEVFIPGRPARRSAADAPAGEARAAEAPGRAGPHDEPAPDAGGEPAPAGTADAPREREARPILPPPTDGDAQLTAALVAHQKAVEARSAREMLETERRIESLRAELGYQNLFAASLALSSQARRLLDADAPEAVRRATFSAELSPDLPYAQWIAARAALRDEPLNPSRWGRYAAEAARASWREPRWRLAGLADAAAALLLALGAASALTLALVFLRHARYFLHDFRHLFPEGAASWQTTPLALLALALPLALGLGAYAFLFALALVAWGHLGRGERVGVAALLCALAALPFAAEAVAERTAFAGTRAEVVWLVERGGLEGGARAALRALAEKGESFPVLFALGRDARRRGEADAAALLRRAAQLRPDSAEAAVELGNALVLQGDLEGARESYQRAAAEEPGRFEPAFNLARLYARKSQLVPKEEASEKLARAQEYTRKVIDLDPRLGQALSEPDYRANLFLAPMSLSEGPLLELAREDAAGARIDEQISARLFGRLPRSLAPAAAALSLLLLLAVGLLGSALRPSTGCSKCGRPVCRRCDAEIVGPGLCSQCLSVFALRGAVDPPARLAKEQGIRRFQRRREVALKASSLLAGAAHVLSGRTLPGALILGLAFALSSAILFRRGIVPAPAGELPFSLRAVPPALALLLLVAVSVRYAFSLFRPGPPRPPAPAARGTGPGGEG